MKATDKQKKQMKKWYFDNKEKKLQHDKLYYNENKEKIAVKRKKYCDKHKEHIADYQKQYRQTNAYAESMKKYRSSKKAKKLHNLGNARYFCTKKGKECRARIDAKRRTLQWIKMFPNPFSNDTEIEWHHITDVYVVAIPKSLHQLYGGNFHREKTMEIIKQIYLGDI